jgi:signal transduction histidine kinase/streptogramin lyase
LVSDGHGGWWVEANSRLRRCLDGQWIADATVWQDEKRTWNRVRWAQADSEGGFWMAYIDGGIVHISASGKLSAITTKQGLPSNRVRTLTLDREGNVWASFESGGLVRVRPRLFQAIGSRDGLSDIVTTSVCQDSHGAIWIGTLGGTISRIDHGVCTNFTLPEEGSHSEMTTVFPDKLGRVWIGTHGDGLLVYEDGKFRPVLTTSQVGPNVRGLFVDDKNRVWIASQTGLFRFSDGKLEQMMTPKSESDYPTALVEGAGGRIWIAMNSGALGCYQDEHIGIYQPQDPAMRCRFAAVYEDAEGTVWIGTLGAGLVRFHEGQFSALTTQNGLPTDNITQVLEDGHERLWLGSPAGIMSVQKSRVDARLEGGNEDLLCHAYGRDDGLPTAGCAIASQPAAWRGTDGRLWFATSKGLANVQPADADIGRQPPGIVLEQIRVDGQPNVFAPATDPASAPYFLSSEQSEAAPIRLSPGRHQVEFRFTGLDFDDPERIRFKYILKGLENSWTESGGRVVSYDDLPPGRYDFCVAAENSEGIWSSGQASLTLIIPPHLWETRSFRVAALASILVLVAGSVFWTLQLRHNRQLRALEHRHALERERVRIAQDIHDDLGASLTRITMLSQSALNKLEPVKPPVVELSRIYNTARSMTNAMDEIVWAINPSNDTLENLAAYFAEFVQEFLTPLGLKFNLDMPLSLPEWNIPSEIRHNVFLAFKEALNNAVKHSGATEVTIVLKIREHGFMLIVEDNGRGFEMTAINGTKTGPGRNSGGNGLANMRSRLEELGGNCIVDSRPGSGTRVTLAVELSK